MAHVERVLPVSRPQVFDALTDPETYPHWLVGARDIRAVDADWPAVGSAFHHRVGLVGPLKVADLSKVLAIDEPCRLELEVRARPLGRGRVTFALTDRGSPDEPSTLVGFDEVPIGAISPLKPLLDPLTAHRNRRSLAQLEDFLLHGRSHRAPG